MKAERKNLCRIAVGILMVITVPAVHAGDLQSFDSGVAITYYREGYPRKRVLADGTEAPIPNAAAPQSPQNRMKRDFELEFSRRLVRGEAHDGVFLGDSLLVQIGDAARRKGHPNRKIWEALAGDHAFLNAGLSADRVRNTLSKVWLITPTARLVAIQIGTNDHRFDRPESKSAETAEGIARLVAEALYRAPEAQILLVAIPPSTKDENQIKRNMETNELIRKLGDHDRVFFVDPSDVFDPAQERLLADGIHFTTEGVVRWYTPLIPWVQTALDGKPLPPAN